MSLVPGKDSCEMPPEIKEQEHNLLAKMKLPHSYYTEVRDIYSSH